MNPGNLFVVLVRVLLSDCLSPFFFLHFFLSSFRCTSTFKKQDSLHNTEIDFLHLVLQMQEEIRIDNSCPNHFPYPNASFQSVYGNSATLRWDLSKPASLSKEGYVIPYPPGAEQMSNTMVNLSPVVSVQKKMTAIKCKEALFQLEKDGFVEIVTAPNLDHMGEKTDDGFHRAYSKQNILLYFKGTPILSIVHTAKW